MSQLTPKQRRFVEEYLVDFDAAAAAWRAGYAESSSARRGAELLAMPHIQAALRSGEAGPGPTIEITPERILEELAKIAFANLGDYFSYDADGTPFVNLRGLSHLQWAAVNEINFDSQGRVRLKISDIVEDFDFDFDDDDDNGDDPDPGEESPRPAPLHEISAVGKDAA